MAKTIILKNVSGSDIDLTTIGKTVYIGEDKDVSSVSVLKLRDDPTLISSILAGDIVVNDGTDDLSSADGENYVSNDFLLEVSDTSATVSKYIKSLKFDTGLSTAELAAGSADIDAGNSSNLIYVFTTGNDITGDGSLTKPYLTIKHALSTISGSASSNRFMIIVGPGVFIEDNPLIIPTYVELFSLGSTASSVIATLNSGFNLIEVSGITAIKGFTLTSSNGGSMIYQDDAAGFCSVDDVTVSTCDHGISCISGNISVSNFSVAYGATIEHVIHVEAGGSVAVDGFGVVGNDTTITVVFHTYGGELSVSSFQINSTGVGDAAHVENESVARFGNGLIVGADNGIRLTDASSLLMNAVSIIDTGTFDFIVEDSLPTISLTACEFNREKLSLPSGFIDINAFYLNNEPDVSGLRVLGNVVAGRPELGTEFVTGRGDPFIRGMMVLTTDDTATDALDGGNITDVTTEAASYTGSTFSFQGVEADHTILFGCNIDENSDKLKFFGLHLKQTTAAEETVKKSFVFERWTGTVWEEFGIMAIYQPLSYMYSKEVFIRGNQTEVIHFGMDQASVWEKKTINSQNLYWVRIRITDDLTTAPVFEQAKLGTSNCTVNQLGVVSLNGLARYRKTILATGNVFGESGGVTYSSPFVGSGGTGWDHYMKNNQLNDINDSLYLQFALPRGVDTSFPMNIIVYYQDLDGTASSDGTIRVSVLPMEVVGVLAADESGGVIPIPRTLADVNPNNVDDAQVIDLVAVLGQANIVTTIQADNIDISDAYEGDIVAAKIELLDDGDADKNIVIWGVEISAVQWLLGDRL